MADLNKIVQRYEAQADTSGLDKMAAAADKAAASSKKLVDATTSLASASEKSDKSALSALEKLDRQTRSSDELTKAQTRLATTQRLITQATAQGATITDAHLRVLAEQKKKVEEAEKAVGGHTSALGLNRVQMMESIHVAKALSDSIIAGANPLKAMAMELGRVGQIIAEGDGGLTGSLKKMGARVAGLGAGWLGFGASVAAGAGLAAAALIRFQSQQDRLALSLNGAGRFAGVSAGGLASIANAAGARDPYLGQGGATNLAATLASTGRISAGIVPGILDMAAPYARGTGQDITKAGEELAKAFADPGKGAEQLNEKLGFLDDKTKQLIVSFERQGDILGAQQVLLAKASDETARMADRTWTLARAWDGFTSALGRGANAFAEGLHRTLDPTLADRLDAALQQRGSSARGPRGGPRSTAAGDATISALRYGLAYQEYGETRLAGAAASDKATNDLSIQIGEAVRKAVPELDKSQELTDTLKLLTDALSNPETVGKTKGGPDAIREAMGRTQGQLQYANPVTRAQVESGLSAQALQAETAAERTAIEARRAEIEVIAAGGSAALAAAKSLGVWNDEIARSNKQAEDALRSAQQRASFIGLSPLQRALKENEYRYDDLRRNSVTGAPGLSVLSPDDMRMTALSPFGDISSAVSAFGGGKLTNRVIPGMHARSLSAYRQLNPGTVDAAAPASSDVTVTAPRVGAYAPAAARFAPGNIAVTSTSASTLDAAQARDAASIIAGATSEKLRLSSEELERNRRLLETRTKALGLDTNAMQKAVHEQELWNDLQREGVTRQTIGAKAYDDMSIKVKRFAADEAAYDQQQQVYDRTVSASNWFQQTGSSIVGQAGSSFGSLFNSNPRDLVSQLGTGDQAKYYAGQLSGGQVKSMVFKSQMGDFLRNLMFQQGIGLIQHGLFGQGQYGSPGYQSGLLGGVFNSLLGGLTGGAGGSPMQLSGATGGGGLFGWLGSLFSGFHFADGGIMTGAGPLPLRRYSGGGVANSPQLALYGEGKGPEAYVPLPDGRSIPVAMKGGGGGSQITLNGHTIVVQGSADDKAIAQMRAELAASNRQMVSDLQRNMGQMQAKWQQRNGS